MTKDYELRPSDFIPFFGLACYRRRNFDDIELPSPDWSDPINYQILGRTFLLAMSNAVYVGSAVRSLAIIVDALSK